MADSLSLMFAVDLPMLRVWPHETPASAGRLGRLHGRFIWAAVAFPSTVIFQEMLQDIY
jgi:hypothetical protein